MTDTQLRKIHSGHHASLLRGRFWAVKEIPAELRDVSLQHPDVRALAAIHQELDPAEWAPKVTERQIRVFLESDQVAELLGVPLPPPDPDAPPEPETMLEAFERVEHEWAPHRHLVDTVDLDGIDVMAMDPRDRATLALLVTRWNPGIRRVFLERAGRWYLTPAVRRVDLGHPFIQDQPWFEDLLATLRERGADGGVTR